jgi:DNA-directed RNA polymerase sigma subunit (sigma70/sigma32)
MSNLKQVQKAHRALKISTVKARSNRLALRASIVSAREKGHTLNEIGQALGMTRQGVYDILRR